MHVQYHGPGPQGPQCDFCWTKTPAYTYPSEAVSLHGIQPGQIMIVGTEGVATCPTCHQDVQDPDINAAAERLLQRCYGNLGALGELHRATMEPYVRRLHASLLQAIAGEPQPFKAQAPPTKD